MYIADNPEIYKPVFLEAKDEFKALNRPELTFAVNYKENLKLINYIYESNYKKNNKNFSITDAIKTFDENKNYKNLMFSAKGYKLISGYKSLLNLDYYLNFLKHLGFYLFLS